MPREQTVMPYESEAPAISFEARPYFHWLAQGLAQVLGEAPYLGAVAPSPQAIMQQAVPLFQWWTRQVEAPSPEFATAARWMYERPEETQLVTWALQNLQASTTPELSQLQTYVPEVISALGRGIRTPQYEALKDIGVGYADYLNRISVALQDIARRYTDVLAQRALPLTEAPTIESLRETDPLVRALREQWEQTTQDLVKQLRQSAIVRGLERHGGTGRLEEELLRRRGTELDATLAQLLAQRIGQRENLMLQAWNTLQNLGAAAMGAYQTAAGLAPTAAQLGMQAYLMPWQAYQQQLGQELQRMQLAAQLPMALAQQQFAQQQALAGLGLQAMQAYQQYLRNAMAVEQAWRAQQQQNLLNLMNWLQQTQATMWQPALQALLGLTGVRAVYGVPAAPPTQAQTAIAPLILLALAGGL